MTTKRSIFEDVGEGAAPRSAPAGGVIDASRKGARGAVRVWLAVLFLMVVAMIAVGGLTRLTDSGLSITEWRPVTGALPPMNEADWATEFEKYKEIPEYQLQNTGMTLQEFKTIYWWEWGHRQLGRAVGLVWALGFLFFWATKRIPPGWTGRLVIPGALGGLQGAIGWWMVSSGLGGERLDVASYRLATHLGLAFVILGVLAWFILLLGRTEGGLIQARRSREPKLFSLGTGLMHFAFLQILIGALVAGIDAGRTFNDWPDMAGPVLPARRLRYRARVAQLLREPGPRAVHPPDGGLSSGRLRGRRLPEGASIPAHRHARRLRRCPCDAGASDDPRDRDGDLDRAPFAGAPAPVGCGAGVRPDPSRAVPRAVSPRAFDKGQPMTDACTELFAFQRETEALGQVMGRLGWDQETVMPEGAGEQRAEEMAALAGVLHRRKTDPRIGDWLEAARPADMVAARQVELIRHGFEKTSRVPEALTAALAGTTSRAHRAWARARAADDFAAFAPMLDEVLRLTRERAEALAGNGPLYDALLDDYEPGATSAELESMFGALRPRLVALRERVLGAERQPPAMSGDFAEAGQLGLSAELARAFGYDTLHGRIDKAVHPFSSGSGLDVRITTRTVPHEPFNCFYSTIHETGHACYEQGIDRAYLLTPIGQGVSMGVHESQSRIYENQLGRGRAFTGWLYARMRDVFGDFGVGRRRCLLCRRQPGVFGVYPHRGGRGPLQPPRPSALRSGARPDRRAPRRGGPARGLERAVREGLRRGGRPAVEWRPAGRPLVGGAVRLFPDLHARQRLCRVPERSPAARCAGPRRAALAEGDTAPATDWLRERIHQHGGLYRPREVIARAVGGEPDEGPLLDYLEAKFSGLYGL